jgi:hypothetical protein
MSDGHWTLGSTGVLSLLCLQLGSPLCSVTTGVTWGGLNNVQGLMLSQVVESVACRRSDGSMTRAEDRNRSDNYFSVQFLRRKVNLRAREIQFPTMGSPVKGAATMVHLALALVSSGSIVTVAIVTVSSGCLIVIVLLIR